MPCLSLGRNCEPVLADADVPGLNSHFLKGIGAHDALRTMKAFIMCIGVLSQRGPRHFWPFEV